MACFFEPLASAIGRDGGAEEEVEEEEVEMDDEDDQDGSCIWEVMFALGVRLGLEQLSFGGSG